MISIKNFHSSFIFVGGTSSSKSLTSSSSLSTQQLVPRFTSRGHTYRAVVGDTLILPCEVENLGKLKSLLIDLLESFDV